MRYRFETQLYRWEARVHDEWHLVDLPLDISAEIREWAESLPRVGFGAVKVTARIGGTSWSSSVFPMSSGHYVLAVGARVRRAEKIDPDAVVELELEVLL